MDSFGPLPLSLSDLEERLKAGQVYSIEGSDDSFPYALYQRDEHFMLVQGSQEQAFVKLEAALFTLLNCLGEFSAGE